jgi:antitoxin component of MazEF toxin-antitoxin module
VSESKVLSFIAQIRSSGAKGQSLIVTIPKEIVEILKLQEKDYAKFMIEKLKME